MPHTLVYLRHILSILYNPSSPAPLSWNDAFFIIIPCTITTILLTLGIAILLLHHFLPHPQPYRGYTFINSFSAYPTAHNRESWIVRLATQAVHTPEKLSSAKLAVLSIGTSVVLMATIAGAGWVLERGLPLCEYDPSEEYRRLGIDLCRCEVGWEKPVYEPGPTVGWLKGKNEGEVLKWAREYGFDVAKELKEEPVGLVKVTSGVEVDQHPSGVEKGLSDETRVKQGSRLMQEGGGEEESESKEGRRIPIGPNVGFIEPEDQMWMTEFLKTTRKENVRTYHEMK